MLWGCKIPILLLYLTLFGVKRWMKVSVYSITAVTGTIFLIMCSWVTANCTGQIDATVLVKCQAASTKAGFTLGLTSVLTDALIFVLPISLIVKLNLPLYKRVGLAIVFAGGLV